MSATAHELPSHDDLVELIRRSQTGCEASAQALFNGCRKPLLQSIRRVIYRRIRSLVDSDDLLLDAFTEIFVHHFKQEVLQSPSRLWPYLKRIAENKVHDAHRKYLFTESSSIRHEVPLEYAKEEDLASWEASPLTTLVIKELVEDRLNEFISRQSATTQAVLRGLLLGKSASEIAAALNIHQNRVYRAMVRLRKTMSLEP
jgi:RNA polymerase sigma factor (sigma-70 family)